MITIEDVCSGDKSFDERVALGHKHDLEIQGEWVDKLSDILIRTDKALKDKIINAGEHLKEIRGDILEAITGYRELTCDDCEDAGKCPFSGDFYNTNGDCLEVK
jgi:hypothetical protein